MISNDYALKIMKSIGITDTDEDIVFQVCSKAAVVLSTLASGGAKIDESNISDNELYIIGIGVNDLLNNTAGSTGFSPAFNVLATQLCTRGKGLTSDG